MPSEPTLLERIAALARVGRYRLRHHAVRHMVEEGFDEGNIIEVMIELAKKPCSECGGRLRPRKIAQEFEREGVRVRLAGIQAWVCSRCGEVYFLPGAADRLAKAARCLFELALAGRQHRGKLTARVS